MNYLTLAGIYNSGPDHWQSHWQHGDSRFSKLEHSSWNHPDRFVWVSELEEGVRKLGPETILVAHSLACLMVAHWAAGTKLTIRGALLVSVPDPDGSNFPVDAKNFGGLPGVRLPFPSTVVSSDNDPYGSRPHMSKFAQAWGSKFVPLAGLGHINAESGLGDWPAGRAILAQVAA